jgi:hypothetical protein
MTNMAKEVECGMGVMIAEKSEILRDDPRVPSRFDVARSAVLQHGKAKSGHEGLMAGRLKELRLGGMIFG